jgi:hypothetical protein
MTETASESAPETQLTTAELDDVFDSEQSEIGALYGLWNIVLNKDCPLFAAMIETATKIADASDESKQLEAKQRSLQKQNESISDMINYDNCTRMSHFKDAVDKSRPDIITTFGNEWTNALEKIYKEHIILVQSFVDTCYRSETLKIENDKYLVAFKALTNRVISTAMSNDEQNLATPVPTETNTADLDRIKTDTRMFLTMFTAIISIAYRNIKSAKSKELIKQALSYTCSIHLTLAKKVSKLHGNLTHVLANGEQCTLCQS